jgi:hypothetical protein
MTPEGAAKQRVLRLKRLKKAAQKAAHKGVDDDDDDAGASDAAPTDSGAAPAVAAGRHHGNGHGHGHGKSKRASHPIDSKCACTGQSDIYGQGDKCADWNNDSAFWCYTRKVGGRRGEGGSRLCRQTHEEGDPLPGRADC